MKKIIFISLILFLISTHLAFAQTVSPTSSPVDQINQQIDELKNRVASKVAELKLVEKRGLIGTVSDVSGTKITINDYRGNTRFIDVDEITKFTSSDESFGLSDIKKGMEIGALGLYNKDSRRLLARFIEVEKIPEFLVGVAGSKGTTNFTLSVTTLEGKQFIVDIEDVTRTYTVSSDGTLQRLGFSKLTTPGNIIVIGFLNPKEKDRVTAGRIFSFEGIPVNPSIPIIQNALNEGAGVTPSTGSGKKLTPL